MNSDVTTRLGWWVLNVFKTSLTVTTHYTPLNTFNTHQSNGDWWMEIWWFSHLTPTLLAWTVILQAMRPCNGLPVRDKVYTGHQWHMEWHHITSSVWWKDSRWRRKLMYYKIKWSLGRHINHSTYCRMICWCRNCLICWCRNLMSDVSVLWGPHRLSWWHVIIMWRHFSVNSLDGNCNSFTSVVGFSSS